VRTIAALCVSGRSIYKHLPGVEAYDRDRDARTFPGGTPVVAHPPCRLWSKFLATQAKSPDPRAEKELGLWCVEQVLKHGGVLEHPAHSRLFEAANLPVPNSPDATPFCYTLYVEQSWFGYNSRKPTWVLVCGVPKRQLVPVPFSLAKPGACQIPGLSSAVRSRSMAPFAEWLCQIARLTWWSLPERAKPLDASVPKAAAQTPVPNRPAHEPCQSDRLNVRSEALTDFALRQVAQFDASMRTAKTEVSILEETA
jgi:hypothetical protein